MTISVSAEGIIAACTILTLVGSVVWYLVMEALKARDVQIASAKTAQGVLFEKYDRVDADLQRYKLHVAETYINQSALERLLAPIERRLGAIEEDLRK